MPVPNLILRSAGPRDALEIARLIRELAETGGEHSPVDAEYVNTYLASPFSEVILACQSEQLAGMLSYSIRPDLFHAGESCLIEELVVTEMWRGQGIGSALLEELLRRARQKGCKEVSVSAMPGNQRALQFYRRHGLVDEAVFLEKHF